jgi:hypothetical protein
MLSGTHWYSTSAHSGHRNFVSFLSSISLQYQVSLSSPLCTHVPRYLTTQEYLPFLGIILHSCKNIVLDGGIFMMLATHSRPALVLAGFNSGE